MGTGNTRRPSIPGTLTGGQVRAALAEFPDDLPLAICVPEDEDTYLTFAVSAGPAYSKVDWGDGRGLVDDERFVTLDAFSTLVALQDRVQIVVDEQAAAVAPVGVSAMTIDAAKLREIEAMLGEDILTDEDLATLLHEAGLPELARMVGQLARR